MVIEEAAAFRIICVRRHKQVRGETRENSVELDNAVIAVAPHFSLEIAGGKLIRFLNRPALVGVSKRIVNLKLRTKA